MMALPPPQQRTAMTASPTRPLLAFFFLATYWSVVVVLISGYRLTSLVVVGQLRTVWAGHRDARVDRRVAVS